MKNPVNVGDYVEISLYNNPTKYSEGKVHQILPSREPNQIRVILNNGNQGQVIRIINSDKVIEERIMSENQHTENKLNLIKPIMITDVLPKTVQSFLNSEGGYLYIGIRDTGSLNERLVGLENDFNLIRKKYDKNKNLDVNTIDKLCDILEMRIISVLEKYLVSDAQIGSLVSVNFPKIHGVIIAEITIKKSEHPWFYRNLNKNNKETIFQITQNNVSMGSRCLDDFYIRSGNSKKRLDTTREFYEYAKNRFTDIRDI